jgi:hypothetical protein
MCRRCREVGAALRLETDVQSGETAEVPGRLRSPEEPPAAAAATADPAR